MNNKARGFFEERPLPKFEVDPQVLRRRTRRDVLLFGLGTVAALAGAGSLLTQDTLTRLGLRRNMDSPGKEWLLNRALRIDDDVAEALYSPRRTVSTTLEYAPQTRRRRRNSTGTFLAWRSSAGAPDHPLGATAFLSSRPNEESHEIALFANPVFAHIAFKVSSLAEFRSIHARAVEKNIPIKFVFNHRVSFAFYFDDPDGNMIEVYWPTGDLSCTRPYAEPLDLSQPDEALLEKITATP
jgi:catechol 2,3-dioxygenase-like lactoylglutathione lyase family enzyme